jgi:hypothetical protein
LPARKLSSLRLWPEPSLTAKTFLAIRPCPAMPGCPGSIAKFPPAPPPDPPHPLISYSSYYSREEKRRGRRPFLGKTPKSACHLGKTQDDGHALKNFIIIYIYSSSYS